MAVLVAHSAALGGGSPTLDASDVDGGTPAVLTLGNDYGCPAAPAPVVVDGGWLFPPARVERVNCMLAGCAAERDYLRDAGFTGTQAAIIAGASAIVTSILSGYVINRTARHLPLLP